ncbi:pyroglutamyl-peptidase I [Paenibacillus elgii]|uniref:pyroglutamyl-peptidase I n=1 Tax=Paenibacillus elgii TaxID=189691 RepID=UPI000248DDC2|nr:pyroglutamyl-peptidase I [Paenibacillus elgii]
MENILVTGFDPFGGQRVNPALETVRRLQGVTVEGHCVETREIPTVFDKSIERLLAAVSEIKPKLVICVGQAGGRPDITIERIAININDARIADNDGQQPIDTPVIPGGPAAYWSTLPIKAMVKGMNDHGIPASVSHTAGTFVCNHLFYGLMHHLATTGNETVRGGFIHIPFLPEQAVQHKGQPSMSLEAIVKGLEAGIGAAIRYQEDIVVSTGQIC